MCWSRSDHGDGPRGPEFVQTPGLRVLILKHHVSADGVHVDSGRTTWGVMLPRVTQDTKVCDGRSG